MPSFVFPFVGPLGGDSGGGGPSFLPPLQVSPQYEPAGATAPNLGSDISALPDLDPTFTLYTGTRVLGEALARRFQTRRGGLFYAPGYGKDLRVYLLAPLNLAALLSFKNDVEREAERDERVSSAVATVTFNPATETLTANLQVTTQDGPFKFVLTVDQVSGATLKAV